MRVQAARTKWCRTSRTVDEQAYQAALAELKVYQKRTGWKHPDLIRPAIPQPYLEAMKQDYQVHTTAATAAAAVVVE